MTEAKLEANIIAAISAVIPSGVQTLGAWSVGSTRAVESNVAGYLSVKVSPRAYADYIAAAASFAVSISLIIRIECDATGASYVSTAEAVSNVLHAWQRNFASTASLSVPNELTVTGVRIDGGDCGIEQAGSVWAYNQSLTVTGVIADPPAATSTTTNQGE